jgi:hypothetical protein
MKKTVNNITIEKKKWGYFVSVATDNGGYGMPFGEQDLQDLEACIHKIKGGKNPPLQKIPYDVSEWIRVGKERGYFNYWLNLPENQPIKKKSLTEKLLLNCSICGEKIEGLPVMTDSDLFHRSCYNKQMKPKRKINKKPKKV